MCSYPRSHFLSSLINITFFLLCFPQISGLCSSSLLLPKKTPRGKHLVHMLPVWSMMWLLQQLLYGRKQPYLPSHNQKKGKTTQQCTSSKRLCISQYGNNILSLCRIIFQLNLKTPWVALGVLYYFFLLSEITWCDLTWETASIFVIFPFLYTSYL